MAGARIKTLVVAGAAAAAMGIGIMPANAAATWTVTAGSAASGTTVAVKGTTKGAKPQIHFTDTTTGTALSCTSGTAPGTVVTGSGQAGNGIGHINGPGTTWTGCTGPLGISLTPTGVGTWNINAKHYNATSGLTNGTITNVTANVAGTGCSFTVTGSVPVSYKNSTTTLSVKDTQSNLVVSNVSGCFSQVNNGDHASFKGAYLLKATTTADNPIHITSP